MGRSLGLFGAMFGGWFGWWVGDHVGFMTAYFLSVIGMGAGLYLARRFTANLFE